MNPNHSMETGLSYPSVANLVILHSSLGETQEEIKEGKMKHLIFIPLLWSGGLQKSNPLQTDTKSTLQLSEIKATLAQARKLEIMADQFICREREKWVSITFLATLPFFIWANSDAQCDIGKIMSLNAILCKKFICCMSNISVPEATSA